MEFLQALADRLKGDYSVKKCHFCHLKDDAIQLQYSVEKLCGSQRQDKENACSSQSRTEVRGQVEVIKGRLLQMMAVIRALQTESNEEQRIFQTLVTHSEHLSLCKPMRERDQDLVNSITELRELYEGNCLAKNDLENIVNRAHHQLNKLEKVLQSGLPSAKRYSGGPASKLQNHEPAEPKPPRPVLRDQNVISPTRFQ
ncbi:uncharacterized protein LOC135477941 [Liolophura sinensis]|uniref:uncharacterized protein LOC135477941 n=1 Tax=Liolophura sinensis TaxID=3198878 RepID=UPI0031581AE2